MLNRFKNSWVLWYDKKTHSIDSENWDKFLVRVCKFEAIDNFSELLGKIIPLSQLPVGASYHFFKEGIEPRWEDKNNIDGGKWMLVFQKHNLIKVDKIWILTLANILSGPSYLDPKQSITGVVGTIKKGQIKISIWTKNSYDENLQLEIGKGWKKLLQNSFLLDKFVIEFFPHKTNISKK